MLKKEDCTWSKSSPQAQEKEKRQEKRRGRKLKVSYVILNRSND